MPTNQQSITAALWSYFRAKGFSAKQALLAIAGAEGNLRVESDFNPAAWNAKEGAQGLAQWEGGRGDSGALGAYARATGGSVTSLTTQEGFLEQELNGPYASTVAALRKATTPQQAAYAWASNFEGNDPSSDGQRESYAAGYYGTLTAQAKSIAAGKPVAFPDTGGATATLTDANVTGGATAVETGAVSSLVGDVFGPVWSDIAKGLFVLAGGALIAVGLFRASGTQTDPAAVAALAAA